MNELSDILFSFSPAWVLKQTTFLLKNMGKLISYKEGCCWGVRGLFFFTVNITELVQQIFSRFKEKKYRFILPSLVGRLVGHVSFHNYIIA